jgi:hypothetical protein
MRRYGTVNGIVTLVTGFAVLCLAVFAVLTLSTAVSESRLSQVTADHVQAYYEADAQAVRITARLSERPDEVEGIPIAYTETEDGTEAEFSVPAGENQALTVRLLLRAEETEILCWKSGYSGEWVVDDNISVWDGN